MPTLDLFHPLRYWSDSFDVIPEMSDEESALDREHSLSDRYAFHVGEALGISRLEQPAEWRIPEMERGYAHGLKLPAKHSDVNSRKLLTLRRNALTRRIPVSTAVTADFLRQITVTVCPVSGVELTQGMRDESDWSIDRLENSLGYVPGNICFVASRVNQLKGSDDFQPIFDEAKAILLKEGAAGFVMDIGNGLMVLEALRIAALMAAPSAFARGTVMGHAPFALAPSTWTTIEGTVAGIHVACARARIDGEAYSRRVWLLKHLGKELWRSSNRLVEYVRRELGQGRHPCDMWLDGYALELLNDLTSEFMLNPPDMPELSDEQAIAMVSGGMKPIANFIRRG